MIRPIITDPIFLSFQSQPATIDDLSVGQDLLDTIRAHRDCCIGMAANMIGIRKQVIIFEDATGYTIMYNPQIIKATESYEASEGCLSLNGIRKAKRYRTIKVEYQNETFQMRRKTYSDRTAQIIQHELDHCNGILI